jgi:hypothetical protein
VLRKLMRNQFPFLKRLTVVSNVKFATHSVEYEGFVGACFSVYNVTEFAPHKVLDLMV